MTMPLPQTPTSRWRMPWLPQGRSRWWVGVLVAGGVVGVGLTLHRTMTTAQSQTRQLPTATVQQTSVAITIAANGVIKPERTINLSPKTSGYLKQLLVQEGDRVQAGQIVAYMDDTNLQGQLTQARAQVAQQQANLDRLLNGNRAEEIAQAQAQLQEAQARLLELQTGNRPEEIRQSQAQLTKAQADLRLATDELRRYEQLFKEGAIPEQTVVQKRSARDVAQAGLNQAQAALSLQRQGSRAEEIAQARSLVEQRRQALNLAKAGARPEDIAMARAQLQAARGALQTVQAQLNDTVIKAPFAGVVTRKYADPGSFVTPTTAGSSVEGSASNSILTLASVYQVVAYLDEANVARVQVGQPVTLIADSYPDRVFNGRVSQIAAQATTTANVTSFEVKIAVDDAAQRLLKIGMNAQTEFQVGQLQNALVVPSAAIVRQANGTGVYRLGADNRPVFQPITIGMTVEEQTEVKSGLQLRDRVLLSFPPGMKPQALFRDPLSNLMPGQKRGNQETRGGDRGNSPSTNGANGGNQPAPAPPP